MLARLSSIFSRFFWPLLLILVLLLGFRAPIVPALLGVIMLFALVARFSPRELAPFFVSAFEVKLQLNTYLVLVLREYIAATGLLGELPAMLSALPLPPALARFSAGRKQTTVIPATLDALKQYMLS